MNSSTAQDYLTKSLDQLIAEDKGSKHNGGNEKDILIH